MLTDILAHTFDKLKEQLFLHHGVEIQQIEQKYTYGINLNMIFQDSIIKVVLLIHPDEDRFLMLVNKEQGCYYVLDLKQLQLLHSHSQIASTYKLESQKYLIIYDNFKYIFVFDSVVEKEEVFLQLAYLQKKIKTFHISEHLDSKALKLFVSTTKTNNKFIDSLQISELLIRLNIRMRMQELKEYIFAITSNTEPILNREEFQTLLKMIFIKTELIQIFQKHHSLNLEKDITKEQQLKRFLDPCMTKDSFSQFLQKEQGMNTEEIEKLLVKMNINNQTKLSFHDFSNFIFSNQNSIINQDKITIHHNMNLPLTEYYVYSSHNTYLSGNQLTSDSKISRYIQDLYNGVRCLQIDIHDGEYGPIVKHGFTFTKKIYFSDVIDAIAEFSKYNQGHFPIILSFQSHCNQKNHKKIAQTLKTKLGNKLYIIPQNGSNSDRFPSPNQLRNKILIQGTGSIENIRPNINKQIIKINTKTGRLTKSIISKDQLKQLFYPDQFSDKKKFYKKNQKLLIEQKQKFIRESQQIYKELNQETPTEVHQNLMQLYSIFVKQVNLQQTCWQMGNLSQNKILNYASNPEDAEMLVQFSKKCWIRVYPQGTRFGSSNFNPIPMYELGAQLVSLNTQHQDPFNFVMTGMFFQNGHKDCGYLLKPEHLRTSAKIPIQYFQVNLKILSCINILNQYNKTPKTAKVFVSFIGSRADMIKNRNGQMILATEKNQKVAFHTTFQNSTSVCFKIQDYYFANIYFTIPDCGSISIPVRMMRSGYRVVPLMNIKKEFKSNSFILVHIQINKILDN